MGDLRDKIRQRITEETMPPYLYTYPTKASYGGFEDSRRACESWGAVSGPIALYLHIPFCEMKCAFCDLFTATRQSGSVIARYVAAILQEMEIMSRFLRLDQLQVRSVYFGGGTPTLLSYEQLEEIAGRLRGMFEVAKEAEWSIEGVPNTFTDEKLRELETLGFNRVSLGVQSFQERELQAMGRKYGAELGRERAEAAACSGIANVNLDLIYGIAGQSLEGWMENLRIASAMGPATITTYPLAVRPRTAFGRKGEEAAIEARRRYEWLEVTQEALEGAGYRQETLVTFAREGGGCRHEANEFEGMPTLAFGAGARKYAPSMHYVDEDYANRKSNVLTMRDYMESVEQGEVPVKSAVILSKRDQQLRYVILGLLASGVSEERYRERFDEPIEALFGDCLEALEQEGFLEGLRLTQKGKKFSSHVGAFIMEEANAEAVVL